MIRRRRIYRSSRISKRRILNVASKKKSDTRLLSHNIQDLTVAPTPQNTMVLKGNTFYACLYCPTAMSATTAQSELESYRSSAICFMRGYSERLYLSTNTGIPWLWRRICFTAKDGDIWDEDTTNAPFSQETSPNGFMRTFTNHNNTAAGNVLANSLFKGVFGRDWQTSVTAKVDRSRYDIKYDKTVVIQPRTSSGGFQRRTMWHPMNRNLIYNDRENGGNEISNSRSTQSRLSMGDYFVYDIFTSPAGTSTDTLTINLQGTLYWHEK